MSLPGRSFWSCSLICLLCLTWVAGCARPTNEVLRKRGAAAYERGDYPAAQNHYSLAVNQSPADWRAHYHLGRTDLALDRPIEARNHLGKAYTIRRKIIKTGEGVEPELTVIADDLAEALFQADLRPQLINFLDERVREFGETRDFIRKGVYLAKIDDPDSSLVALKQAQRLDFRDPEVYLAQADFYERIGRRDLAVLCLRRAYGLAPERQEIAERLENDYDQVMGPTIGLPPEKLPPLDNLNR